MVVVIDAVAEPGLVAPPEAVAVTPLVTVIDPALAFVADVVAVTLTPTVPPGEIETELAVLLTVEPADAVTGPKLTDEPVVEKPEFPGEEKDPEKLIVTVKLVLFV